MRSHLTEIKDAFLMPAEWSDDLPGWAKNVKENGAQIHRFNATEMPADLRNNIVEVTDFLYSAAEKYVDKTFNLS